ncbi:MAG: DMT family transporter [Bacteroidales bacterium]|nr:DMT family transporter [Bacteroidales bacterium]
MEKNTVKGVLFAATTAFFWGFLAIALKMTHGLLEPVNVVWFRFLVAFSALLLYFSLRRRDYLKILVRPPLFLVIGSIGLAMNYIGFLYGVQFLSPTTAQVVIQMGPIMLGFVGFAFFRERINRRQASGYLLAGMGLLIFYRSHISGMATGEELQSMGVLWIVIAAMAWVVYASFQKILVRRYPAQQLNLFLFGLPVLLFIPFIHPGDFSRLTFHNWLLLFYLGINTLVAYGCLAMAFKYLEASKVSIIITMNPVITFITMAVLTTMEISWVEPERLSTGSILAAIMVLTGAVMAVTRADASKKRPVDQLFRKETGKTE